MKLIIGNRNYSSWSLRGWLAMKQSGLSFEVELLPLYGTDWEQVKQTHPGLAPSQGQVPVLWDESAVVWDSLAILEYLADKVGRDRFWPRDEEARALARAMVAEMHSGFAALRNQCPMNIRRRFERFAVKPEVRAEVVRILTLWAEARSRFGQGGPFLFGTFSAADIAFAPVVTRLQTYGIGVPGFAEAYMQAVLEHEWMRQWATAAEAEDWVVAGSELPGK